VARDQVAMSRRSSFAYSFLALPAAKRRAITALFDFCRVVDDSVDLETNPDRVASALELWREEIDRMFGAGEPRTKEAQSLAPVVRSYALSREHLDALVDGVAMDAAPRQYDTFVELELYCHRVASAVGLLCIPIFGYSNPGAIEYARDLGVALQLTNILRDVAVDYRRGRVYLPAEDLQRFGCTAEDIAREVAAPGRGIANAHLRSVLEHHAARARVFFARATRALPAEDAANFVAAEIMRKVYADLLRRIEAAQCDVFTRLIKVPRPVQARIAIATLVQRRTRARS
jgi:phytoene synthase